MVMPGTRNSQYEYISLKATACFKLLPAHNRKPMVLAVESQDCVQIVHWHMSHHVAPSQWFSWNVLSSWGHCCGHRRACSVYRSGYAGVVLGWSWRHKSGRHRKRGHKLWIYLPTMIAFLACYVSKAGRVKSPEIQAQVFAMLLFVWIIWHIWERFRKYGTRFFAFKPGNWRHSKEGPVAWSILAICWLWLAIFVHSRCLEGIASIACFSKTSMKGASFGKTLGND